MTEITMQLDDGVFSALRRVPDEFVREMASPPRFIGMSVATSHKGKPRKSPGWIEPASCWNWRVEARMLLLWILRI